MSRPTSRNSRAPDSPFAALHRYLVEKIELPKYEDGWRSAEEVAKELGVGKPHAQSWLCCQAKAGLVERWRGKAYQGRRAVPCVRYRVVSDGPKKSSEK